jgi:hypothetical protein
MQVICIEVACALFWNFVMVKVCSFGADFVDSVPLLPATASMGNSEVGSTVRGKPFAVRKPVALFRELIRVHTDPGDVIVEFACGSAPAARAAMLEGRSCVSFDSDELIIPSVIHHHNKLRDKVLHEVDAKQFTFTVASAIAVAANKVGHSDDEEMLDEYQHADPGPNRQDRSNWF